MAAPPSDPGATKFAVMVPSPPTAFSSVGAPGSVLGTNSWPTETDGPALWRSVGAYLHDSLVTALSCTGDVTYNPLTQGSGATCTSSGNVTSLTIAPPDDYTGRTIEGFQVTLRLVAGNASHTWPSAITNAVLPAGMTLKATTTLNGVDTLKCTYYATPQKYYCNIESGTQQWQGLDSDLTALASNSTSGFWARTGSGTGSARTTASKGLGLGAR